MKPTESMQAFAEKVVRDDLDNGEIRPRVYVISSDGIFMYFDYVPGPEGDESLENMRRVILRFILALRITGTLKGVAMLGEGWASIQKTGEPRKYAHCEDDPNRTEIVFYSSYESDGTLNFKVWKMVRGSGAPTLKDFQSSKPPNKYDCWLDSSFGSLGEVSPEVVIGAVQFVANLRKSKGV